mgnify:CR=1 FL=1
MRRLGGDVWDKICSLENIKEAHHRAREDKSFYKEVKMVNENEEYYCKLIQEMLINGTYQVSPYEYKKINDNGKERTLMKLPYFPDRIIQWAIMLQIEDTFLQTFCYHTCASIPGRGNKRVRELINKYMKDKYGTKYCLQIDVKKFYDNISHKQLKKLLRRKIKNNKLLSLLDLIVDSYPGEVGIPIGSYLSQYLANFYLSYFDHYLKEKLHVKYVVRYMDDMILFSNDKHKLWTWYYKSKQFLKRYLKLEVKSNYAVYPTRIRGVDYIGYRYFGEYILLRKKITKKFKKLAKKILHKQNNVEKITHREWAGINSYLGYLKWCDSYKLFEKYIEPIIPSMIKYYQDNICKNYSKKKKAKRTRQYFIKIFQKKGRCYAA